MRQNNSVELIGYYGSDEIIACSAWTSTSRQLTEDKRQRIGKMIDMLWSEGHHTPFEKGIVHFLVNTDIATHIHILKHRISSLNAESARYKEIKDNDYYIPMDWDNLIVQNKSVLGALQMCDKTTWADVLREYTVLGLSLYHACLKDIEDRVGRKRAKESARFFRPYSTQIQADWMINMRSFANFIKLRRSKHAQKEIRYLANDMLTLVKNIEGQPFKHTLQAWEKTGVIQDDWDI